MACAQLDASLAVQAPIQTAHQPQSLSPHPPPPPADAPSREHTPDDGGVEQPAHSGGGGEGAFSGMPPSALGNLLDSVRAADLLAVICPVHRAECARLRTNMPHATQGCGVQKDDAQKFN